MATQRIVIYMPLISICSCQRTFPKSSGRRLCDPRRRFQVKCCQKVVGVTGVEPVTLRLSSACSNQLSYTPAFALRALAGKPAHACQIRPGRLQAGLPAVARKGEGWWS